MGETVANAVIYARYSSHGQQETYGPAGKESTCSMGDLGSIPGLGRSPREGKGYH